MLFRSGEETLTFAIDAPKGAKIGDDELAAHLAFGAYLRSYRFDHYRKVGEDEKPTIRNVVVATKAATAAKALWPEVSAVGEGIFIARDLVNEPPNVLYPDEAAKRTLALRKLGVKVDVLGIEEMRKLGMNTLLGVGQGSAFESRMVVMQWNGVPKGKPGRKAKGKADEGPLAFIGKGVCFDSGGLSLKPAASMMGMKGDMAGAAAVVGLMHTLAKRKARVNAGGLIGLVENMPDGNAQRPNDIVKTMSGQTIEVLNTDAEGRLVLADVLTYAAREYAPQAVVDAATLTGAIVIAFGNTATGVMGTDQQVVDELLAAGRRAAEPGWQLPTWADYKDQIKSDVADVKNIGGRGGGSITAAMFLAEFTEGAPWAHLDIAGTAYTEVDLGAFGRGPTGVPVRTFVEFVRGRAR